MPSGHQVLFVPTPYCHFRGAVMLYDPETRVLFSGDLFGGLTELGVEGIWADEGDWHGMRAFHQIYMPAGQALRNAMSSIRKLDPPVEIIAPQHGRVIRGELVEHYIHRLSVLPVGLDIQGVEGDDELHAWGHVLERVLETARMFLGASADTRLAEAVELSDTVKIVAGKVSIGSLGRWSVERALDVLTRDEPPETANPIKLEAIVGAESLQLPTPTVTLEESESHVAGPSFS